MSGMNVSVIGRISVRPKARFQRAESTLLFRSSNCIEIVRMALSLTFLTRFLANSSISSCAIIDLSTEFLSPRYYISGSKALFGAKISARDVVKVRKD